MDTARMDRAMHRIEAALARIEAAAASVSRPDGDPALTARHAALRQSVETALSQLDATIEGLER